MIFVDMDGVLADFDTHHERCFGVRPTRWPDPDNVDWAKVKAIPNYFLTIPPMPDMDELVAGLHPRPWTVLTGCPRSVNASSNQKRDWGRARLGPKREMICCPAREKCLHGKPGDILIDDYLKYRDLWTGMGGIFIHHTSAANSIRQLGHVERLLGHDAA